MLKALPGDPVLNSSQLCPKFLQMCTIIAVNYLEGQGDVLSRCIVGISAVIMTYTGYKYKY